MGYHPRSGWRLMQASIWIGMVLLMSGCGGGNTISAAEVEALRSADFWRMMGLILGGIALLVGLIVGVISGRATRLPPDWPHDDRNSRSQ